MKGVLALAGGLLLFGMRLWHNWKRSQEAEARGAARAAEVREKRQVAEAEVATAEVDKQAALKAASGAARAAAQLQREAKASGQRADAARDKAVEIKEKVQEAGGDVAALDALARQLGFD